MSSPSLPSPNPSLPPRPFLKNTPSPELHTTCSHSLNLPDRFAISLGRLHQRFPQPVGRGAEQSEREWCGGTWLDPHRICRMASACPRRTGAGCTRSPTPKCPSAVLHSFRRTRVRAPQRAGRSTRRRTLYPVRADLAPCFAACSAAGIGRQRTVAPSYMGSSDWSKGRVKTAAPPDFTKVGAPGRGQPGAHATAVKRDGAAARLRARSSLPPARMRFVFQRAVARVCSTVYTHMHHATVAGPS